MNLTQLQKLLADANNLNIAKLVLNKYLVDQGFKYYAFTFYSGHIKSGRKLVFECTSLDLRNWHEYYIKQNYADVDRTLEENANMTIPLFWDVHEQLKQAKNIREKRIRQESIKFGIDKGLSIPIHGPNYDFATLTLHQYRDQTTLKDYEAKQFEWMNAALLFYHHIKTLMASQSSTISFSLTKREKRCLDLTAKGLRVEHIAKELKISPRTVNFHLQNANRKLGTNNKYLSIFKYQQF